jgi:hypothetical protein
MDETHIAYIFNHYDRFMTPAEREAWTKMGIVGRFDGPDGPVDRTLASTADDPAVVALAAKGWTRFRQDVAQRILEQHPDEIAFNYCPSCRALCRTPKAQQCPHCKHHWHSTRAT